MTNESTPTAMAKFRRLGSSGLRVSVPILGGGSFGSSGWMEWIVAEDRGIEILKAAWEKGVTTIDTANTYSNGESERIIGRFLKSHDIPRQRVLILTKCHGLVHSDPGHRTYNNPKLRDDRDFVNQGGLSRAAIFNQVEGSLERLQTSYIDMLQIHRFDPNTSIEETMKALHDVVQSGKVRYLGASSMRTWQFVKMNEVAIRNGWTPFVSMQSEYSLLYREDEREMIPYCKANGIGLIPWSPLHQGDLAKPVSASSTRRESPGISFGGLHNDVDKAIVGRVEEVAKKKGWKMSEVALAWINTKVDSPIVGCSSAQRLEESIIGGKELTNEEITYLEELYVPKPVRGHL